MRLKTLTSWYLRNERWITSLSLFGGFVFDIFALKRIDLFWENLWVTVHLGVAALCIILINLVENHKDKVSAKTHRIIHFWLIFIVQFAFGGLLSTFLVFYFRSGTFSSSWPFMLVLASVFIINERLKHHYTRLVFQTSVLFISIYSFAIFIVPVIFHQIGPEIFILSGIISLVILFFFLFILRFVARERFQESKKLLFFVILFIATLINVLYFKNVIPPIPLSLKDAGVYHSIVRVSTGNYIATGEQQTFWDFFKPYELFHEVGNQPIYVFSSIFSPADLNTDIIHEWQHYNETTKNWDTINQVKLSIIGGRDGGFRTYSIETVDLPGLWRVEVKTLQGQHIGRIKFEVQNVDTTPDLISSKL